MCKVAAAIIAGLALSLAYIPAGFACEGEEVLFEDSFDELDPSWGEYETFQIFDGQFHVLSKGPWLTRVPSNFSIYDDADICVTTIHVAGSPDQTDSGILFWYVDADNYYMFHVSSAGTWAADRRFKGKWLTVVPGKQSPAIKTGEDAENRLRVVTRGNVATLFINGTQVAKFKGVPPKDGQLVGVVMQQFADGETTEGFDDFKVTTVAAEP